MMVTDDFRDTLYAHRYWLMGFAIPVLAVVFLGWVLASTEVNEGVAAVGLTLAVVGVALRLYLRPCFVVPKYHLWAAEDSHLERVLRNENVWYRRCGRGTVVFALTETEIVRIKMLTTPIEHRAADNGLIWGEKNPFWFFNQTSLKHRI